MYLISSAFKNTLICLIRIITVEWDVFERLDTKLDRISSVNIDHHIQKVNALLGVTLIDGAKLFR